jgi:MinD superfamily P-loop ATPase
MMVSRIRQKTQETNRDQDSDLIIIDGSPGIGCPVIASVAGTDRALVAGRPVVEFTQDGPSRALKEIWEKVLDLLVSTDRLAASYSRY